METEKLKQILEAALMVAAGPVSFDRLHQLFADDGDLAPSREQLRTLLEELENDYHHAGIELVKVGSGYRFQARSEVANWVARLWDEKIPRYSRALLETLAIVAYRQPITRGEIENIRGVAVSTNMIRTLLEREWVRIVGHRDVPGKPAVYATTKQFLDYFNLTSLNDLPSLAELRDVDDINADLFANNAAVEAEKMATDDVAIVREEQAADGAAVDEEEMAADGAADDEEEQAAATAAVVDRELATDTAPLDEEESVTNTELALASAESTDDS